MLAAYFLALGPLGRPARDESLQRAQREGIRIGYALEPPYAFLAPDGTVTGESPEIARLIAKRLGIGRVEWRLSEFNLLLSGLHEGRFDVVAAGVFITSERKARVAFSRPTFQVGPALLVAAGNPLQLDSYAALVTNPAVRVAVLSGSVEERELMTRGMRGAQMVAVPDARTGRDLVLLGEAQALALSSPSVRHMVAGDPDGKLGFAAVRDLSSGGASRDALGLGGVAFRKGDVALREAWDRELEGFVGSTEHRALVAPFGFTTAEMPDGVAGSRALPGR